MHRESIVTPVVPRRSSGRTGSRTGMSSASNAARLSRTDERRALQAAAPSRGRRYRCGSCGLSYPSDEITEDFDEAGNRVGWTCEHCW